MFPKKLVLWSLPVVFFVFFAAGCFAPSAQFGAPGNTGIKGVIVMPDNTCYTYNCSNPQVSEGEPAAEAEILLQKEDGSVYTTAKADACGKYEIGNVEDACYILYAKIKGGSAWVKKGIDGLTSGKMNDVGEANYYTTAQVIIYEVAKQMFPNAVKCSDIPGFVPTQALLTAVKDVLSKCKDAQQDQTVISLARGIVMGLFGAPGGGGGGGTVTIFEAGGGTTTPDTGGGDGGNGENGGDGGDGGSEEPGEAAPDFSIEKEILTAGPYYPGDNVTYQVTIENKGNVAITPENLTDNLAGTYTVSPVPIPVGGKATGTYQYTIPATTEPGTEITNTASATVNGVTKTGSVTIKVGTPPAPCTPASITDFTVTATCDDCASQKPKTKVVCPTCSTPPSAPCETCEIKITNVQASGTGPLQYQYSYKKQSDSTWTSSGWKNENEWTFTNIQACSSVKYDVKVEVKNDYCTTESAFMTKEVTLEGSSCTVNCCKFDFFGGQGTQKAKWEKIGNVYKVKVQFQIKDVCQYERINMKVEVYKKSGSSWVFYAQDNTSFTNMAPNPGGNITIGPEWQFTTITRSLSPGPHSNWKFKFTITEAQGYCPNYSKTKEDTFSN